ncbi:hypothetical protein [Acinetobacter soli]|uniref:hypothetical protein n=1 Tax=Acinetobacter soli TaxID=487316 RepID=UPI00300D18F1
MTTKKTDETKEVTEKSENNDCFIIMPIADHPDYKQGHFKRVYDDIFKPACIAAGYRPVRADDTKQANLIQLDILQKLLESPMAICDLSTRNPNVLFELGLRQAFDKPTILVQEEGTPRIFDINIFRYVEYRKSLDYREVLADQRAIEEVLIETKQAVVDGKSVNSIIKLLSMTNPAVLQDSSNFGEKEYFNVLMSEFGSLKKQIYNMNQENKSINKDFNSYKEINSDKFYLLEILFDRVLTGEEYQNIFDSFLKSSLIEEVGLMEAYIDEKKNYKMIVEIRALKGKVIPKAYIFNLIKKSNLDNLKIIDIFSARSIS